MERLQAPEPLRLAGNVSASWKRFKQKFELFLQATEVKDQPKSEASKAALLLSIAGDEALDVFNNFKFEPNESKDGYKTLMQKFDAYCSEVTNEVHERYLFRTRTQAEGEPFEKFLRDLKKQASQCNFGASHDSLESGDDFWQGLLAYRSAPLEDGRSPGELLQGRRLRANLPDFHEVPCTEVKKHCQHAQGKPLPKLSRGDVVRLRGTRTWSRKARVRGTQAPRSYQLVTEDGQVLRRNRKHLIRTDEPYDETSSEDGDDTTDTSTPVDNPQVPAMHSSAGSTSQASESSRTTAGAQQCSANTEGRPTPDSVLTPAPRRSSRNTRPPQRLRYDEAFNQIA
ncbi:uncharacterized protein [Dermacentor albipictus]|uniref:uncharacterized protein isoform X2 n=1 Tax=Dermacentor albipictus TaxID=60249 RepID=UPI0038FD0318